MRAKFRLSGVAQSEKDVRLASHNSDTYGRGLKNYPYFFGGLLIIIIG